MGSVMAGRSTWELRTGLDEALSAASRLGFAVSSVGLGLPD